MAEPPKRPQRPSQAARPSAARPIGGRTSQIDRAMALRDAVAQAVESEKSFKKKTVGRGSKARLVTLLVIATPLLAVSIYSWVARPAFIWGPAVAPRSVAQSEANLKAAIFFLGMRLDAYREEQGFYPASLAAIGETIPGVTYELITDSVFELRGVVGRQPVLFRSDMTAEEYLGGTKELISSRRAKR